MPPETTPVAVIGLGAFGRQMAEALADLPDADLVGVADRDAQRADDLAEKLGVPAWADNRQMLLSTRPEAVFLATPPMPAGDLLEFCASHGMAVWKEAPLARNLAEAVAIHRRFTRAKLPLLVGVQRRFADAYRRTGELKHRIGNVFLVRAHYLFDWTGPLGWRSDLQSAGGGALLELGCHLVDLLLGLFGLPEEVYALTHRCDAVTGERTLPPHDTDDTACMMLRHAGEAVATAQVSRITGPVSEGLDLHGCGGSIHADADTCTLREASGDVREHVRECNAPADLFRRQAENALRVVREAPDRYPASAGQAVLAHAVLDAAYLSSQTLTPESPLRQLQLHSLRPEDCLRHSQTDNP
jgi:predicted dehydrogenase